MGILGAELYSSPVGKIGTGTVNHPNFFQSGELQFCRCGDYVALIVESYSSADVGTM